jgi:hypothetical protein
VLSDVVKVAELVLRQIDAQQEIRDRWFNYYLLITAGSVTLATSLASLFRDSAPRSALYLIISALFFLTAVLGCCFHQIYARQRVNYTNHYLLLAELQKLAIEHLDQGYYERFYPTVRPFFRRRRGADFFTLLAQAVLASAYMGAAVTAGASSAFSVTPYTLLTGVIAALVTGTALQVSQARLESESLPDGKVSDHLERREV